MTIKQLIKDTFDLWVQHKWLQQIKRVIKKRNKYYASYRHYAVVAKEMFEGYVKIYGKDCTDG